MKKFLTFILVLAMVMSVSSFAVAAGACADSSCTTPHVAAIDTAEYHSLQDAVDAAAAGQTVKVLKEIDLDNDIGYLLIDKKVTLDLNGKTISHSNVLHPDEPTIVLFGGELTITDTASGNTGMIVNNVGKPAIQVQENGKVIINGGNINSNADGIYVLDSGTVEMNSGSVTAASTPKNSAITLYPGTATITGGTLQGYNAITANENSQVTISDGTLISSGGAEGAALWATGNTNVTVNGGTLEGSHAMLAQGDTGVDINGGTLKGKVEAVEDSDTTISGGEFSEAPADALLDTDAVAVGNTSDGFKVVQTVNTSDPVVTVFPTFHDFGSIEQGGSFVPKTFTVINGGNGEIEVELPAISKCMVQWADGTTGRKTLKTIASKTEYSAEFTVVPNASLAQGEYKIDGDVNVYWSSGNTPSLTKHVKVEFKITAPATAPSTGGGYYFVGVRYNGGNSFSTDRPDVPVAVLIDGQPVSFTGNGSNFVVDCINPGASRITIVWNTIKVDARFTPDANAYCAQAVIPKTGGMSIWAAIAQFLGF